MATIGEEAAAASTPVYGEAGASAVEGEAVGATRDVGQQILGLAAGIGDAGLERRGALAERRAALEAHARDLQRSRKRLAQDMRNEEKRRMRVMERARALPTESLIEILGQRAAAVAKGKSKSKAKAKGKSKARGAAPIDGASGVADVEDEASRADGGLLEPGDNAEGNME